MLFVPRLTWRVSLVEQELLTLPEHLSSPPVFSGVHVTRSLVLYVIFLHRCLSLWYLLAIVLSVLVGLAASHYPFGIFWPLCCLFLLDLRLLITSLASSNLSYCLWIIRSCLEHTIYYTWGEPTNYYTMDEVDLRWNVGCFLFGIVHIDGILTKQQVNIAS